MVIFQAMSLFGGNDLFQLFYLTCSNFCLRNIGITPSIFACDKTISVINKFDLKYDQIINCNFNECAKGAQIKLNAILKMPANSAICDADVLFSVPFSLKSPSALNSEKVKLYRKYNNCDYIIKKCIPKSGITANAGLLYCEEKDLFDEYATRALALDREFTLSGNDDNGICFEQMFWERFWEEKKIQTNFIATQSDNDYNGILEMYQNHGIFHPISLIKRNPEMIKKAVEITKSTQFKDEFEHVLNKHFPSILCIVNFA